MSRHEIPEIAPGHPLGGFAATQRRTPEPITEKQAALLRNLCEKAGEPFDGNLSRRQAQARIDTLREKLGTD